MSDNPARDLAAIGTPGPWSAHEGDLEGGTPLDYIATLLRNRERDGTTTGRLFLTLGGNDEDPELGAELVTATTGDGPSAEANAVRIARAVNALPALADLLDAVDAVGHREGWHGWAGLCSECSSPWPCPTYAAAERVKAALRGETDGE